MSRSNVKEVFLQLFSNGKGSVTIFLNVNFGRGTSITVASLVQEVPTLFFN